MGFHYILNPPRMLRWWMSRRKLCFLLQSIKISQYQSIIWKFTKEPISTIRLLENHVGDDKVTLIFLLWQNYLQILETLC